MNGRVNGRVDAFRSPLSSDASLRVRVQPCPLNLVAKSGVDDESAEWVDEGHVERRQSADGFHIHGGVGNVALLTIREGQCQEAMYRRIADLAKSLAAKNVEDSKRPVPGSWRKRGPLTIIFGQSMDIRCGRRVMTLVVPPEHAAEPPAQRKQGPDDDIRLPPPIAKEECAQVLDGAIGAAVGQWNRPHVVQRYVTEKCVTAQIKCFEVGGISHVRSPRFGSSAVAVSLNSRD